MSIKHYPTDALSRFIFAKRDTISPNPEEVSRSLGSLVNPFENIRLKKRPVIDMRLIAENMLRAGGGESIDMRVTADKPAQYFMATGPVMKDGYFYSADRTYDYFISPFSSMRSDPHRSPSSTELMIRGLRTPHVQKGLLPDPFRKDLTNTPLDNATPKVPIRKNILPSKINPLDNGNPTKTNKSSLADLLLKPEKPVMSGIYDENTDSSHETVPEAARVFEPSGRYLGQWVTGPDGKVAFIDERTTTRENYDSGRGGDGGSSLKYDFFKHKEN